MIPPSRNSIWIPGYSEGGDLGEDGRSGTNMLAIPFAVLELIAFKSTYTRVCSKGDTTFFRAALSFITLAALLASLTRDAVVTASTGGTMLKIISDSATKASSFSTEII